MKTILTTLGVSLFVLASCTGQKSKPETDFIAREVLRMQWHRKPFRPILLKSREEY